MDCSKQSSILLTRGYQFKASRLEGTWDVVVGDNDIGYSRRREIKNWAGVELFVRGAVLNMYGIVI